MRVVFQLYLTIFTLRKHLKLIIVTTESVIMGTDNLKKKA